MAGWIPRASSRSSWIASFSSDAASSAAAIASASSPRPAASRPCRRRSASDTDTRRCCAPSWRSRSSRRRSSSVASTIRARERRTSASTARTSVKSRTIAVTSFGPLGATRASSSRAPARQVQGEVVGLEAARVERIGRRTQRPLARDREHRSWRRRPDRHASAPSAIGALRGVRKVRAVAIEADHPIRDRVDDRPEPSLALAVEPDQRAPRGWPPAPGHGRRSGPPPHRRGRRRCAGRG